MGLPTYTPLATITLTGTDTSIDFVSIPAIYRDLVIVMDVNQTAATAGTRIRFNGDSGSNYTWVEMWGNGSSIGSGSATETSCLAGYHVTGGKFTIVSQIQDYSTTDKHKTVLSRDSLSGEVVRATASRWANTAAITSLSIFPTASSYASGSTFSLYGIVG